MQNLQYAVPFILLSIYTVSDIREKKIWWPASAAAAAAGLLLYVLHQDYAIGECLTGMLPGTLLLLIGVGTGGAIGSGDCAALIACGSWLGFYGVWQLLLGALGLAAVWAITLLLRGRDRQTQFPFIPFMLAAEICLWISSAVQQQ